MNEVFARLEQELQKDPALQEKFAEALRQAAGENPEMDEAGLAMKAAQVLGFVPARSAGGELDDDELDQVSGGVQLSHHAGNTGLILGSGMLRSFMEGILIRKQEPNKRTEDRMEAPKLGPDFTQHSALL